MWWAFGILGFWFGSLRANRPHQRGLCDRFTLPRVAASVQPNSAPLSDRFGDHCMGGTGVSHFGVLALRRGRLLQQPFPNAIRVTCCRLGRSGWRARQASILVTNSLGSRRLIAISMAGFLAIGGG